MPLREMFNTASSLTRDTTSLPPLHKKIVPLVELTTVDVAPAMTAILGVAAVILAPVNTKFGQTVAFKLAQLPLPGDTAKQLLTFSWQSLQVVFPSPKFVSAPENPGPNGMSCCSEILGHMVQFLTEICVEHDAAAGFCIKDQQKLKNQAEHWGE